MCIRDRVDVVNTLGQAITYDNLTGDRGQIQLGSAPAGVYLVTISNDRGKQTKRVMKR